MVYLALGVFLGALVSKSPDYLGPSGLIMLTGWVINMTIQNYAVIGIPIVHTLVCLVANCIVFGLYVGILYFNGVTLL